MEKADCHRTDETGAHVSGSGQVEPKRSIEGGGATGRTTFALDRLKVGVQTSGRARFALNRSNGGARPTSVGGGGDAPDGHPGQKPPPPAPTAVADVVVASNCRRRMAA